MAVHRLPLSRDSQARVLLRHLLEHAEVAGRDQAGRTVLALHVADRMRDELAAFDIETEDLEGDEDLEDDAPPVTGCGNRTI